MKRYLALFIVLFMLFGGFAPTESASAALSEDKLTYTVEQGESLTDIGYDLGISWYDLCKWNDIPYDWQIQPGDVLVVSGDSAQNVPLRTTKRPVDEDGHGLTAFADMTYTKPDIDAFAAEIVAIGTLLEENGDVFEILFRFDEACAYFSQIITELRYLNVLTYLDVTDTESSDEYNWLMTEATEEQQNLIALGGKMVENARTKYAVREYWGYEEVQDIIEAQSLVIPEVIPYATEEEALVTEYMNLMADFKATINDTQMNLEDIEADTTMTSQQKSNATRRFYTQLANSVADVYIKMIANRNTQAQLYGFDSYAEYCYDNFERDYTPEEITQFHSYVKEIMVPLFDTLNRSFTEEDINQLYYTAYNLADKLDTFELCVSNVSEDFRKACQYMRNTGLYECSISDTKGHLTYTTFFDEYHTPFISIEETDTCQDVMSMVHEFGHFTAYYLHDSELTNNLDVLEIHSQGLEMLMNKYAEKFYGDGADTIIKYQFYSMLNSIIYGCIEDEFQQKVYAMEPTTTAEIHNLYDQILKDYGMSYSSGEMAAKYTWIQITHTFEAPFYYISYATSAIPSLEILSVSNEDWNRAAESYLYIMENGDSSEFVAVVEGAGLASPFTKSTIEDIGAMISEYIEK